MSRGIRELIAAVAMAFSASAQMVTSETVKATQGYRMPPAFVENVGQWETADRFVSLGGAAVVRVRSDRLVLQRAARTADGVRIASVELEVAGAASSGDVEYVMEQSVGLRHFLLGDDPSRWRRDVPAHASLRMTHPADDSVLTLKPTTHGLRLTCELGPQADPSSIVIRLRGGQSASNRDDGTLVISTGVGQLVAAVPVAHVRSGSGTWRAADARVSRGATPDRFGWETPERAPGEAVQLELEFEWSTFFGGSFGDDPIDAAVDSTGRVLVAGRTFSADLPTTPDAFDPIGSGDDVFLAVFPEGGTQLLYATYLGGPGGERPESLFVGPDDSIYVSGYTAGLYPVTDGSTGGQSQVFLSRLDSAGSTFLYSTTVGGSKSEFGGFMGLGADGVVTLVGATHSANFPATLPGFNATPPGLNLADFFVARIDTEGAGVLWTCLVGGEKSATAHAMAIDAFGDVIVSGVTQSLQFPLTPNATTTTPESYVLFKLSDEGTTLEYSSYFGFNGVGAIRALAFSPTGDMICAGVINKDTLPIKPAAFQPEFKPLNDGIVVSIDPQSGGIASATYIGGPGDDVITDLEVDASGVLTVAGRTRSSAFPVTKGAFQTAAAAPSDNDFFVARLDPRAERLLYGTYIGGTDEENLHAGIFVDERGSVLFTGDTESPDFPVSPHAYDTTHNGSNDALVMRLSMLPTGVARYGTATPGCLGPLPIGVTAMPEVGKRFGFTCSAAPPSSTNGFLLVGRAPLATPVTVNGADLWMDPASLTVVPRMRASDTGFVVFERGIPPDPTLAGFTVAAQFVFPDTCAPGGFSASNALLVTVQPP